MSELSEEEKKKLPSFEDWVDQQMKPREDYYAIRTNVIYYGIMSNMTFCRSVLVTLGKENNGMQKADSEEFKKVQQEWWYYYRKIMCLRAFLLRYFDLPPPNWKQNILPERLYCGVLLAEEDFVAFLTKKDSGISHMEKEKIENYDKELRGQRGKSNILRDEFKEEDEVEEAAAAVAVETK